MNDEEEDYDIDDILNEHKNRKKRKKSGDKGKRGERNLIEELETRFPGKPFSRTLGSGNRWSQARLTETAKKVFTGDIVTPEEFLFALECKHGYNDIDLEKAIKRTASGKGNKLLDTFLEQAEKDGQRVDKMPMMCWKKDYQPWLAFLKSDNTPKDLKELPEVLVYRDWVIIPLLKVLQKPDDFFLKA